MKNLDGRLADAVKHFWKTRLRQGRNQGTRTGQRDHGSRASATGGKQLDGFNHLIRELLVESGIPEDCVYLNGRKDVTIPGFFRPTKQWDVLVVSHGCLLAAIECKALCGPSFGNNYNNRVEEALGSATDLWTAYRENAFGRSSRPFLGYILLLEQALESTRPVSVVEQHFPVFDEFQGASYEVRCTQTLLRLLRERSYDAASLIVAERNSGADGQYTAPAPELNFERFATLMCGHVRTAFDTIAG